MTKFTISNSLANVSVDYGGGVMGFRMGEQIERISADIGQYGSKICIQRGGDRTSVVHIFELEDYSYGEIAELLSFLITSFKAKYLHMDYVGAGLAVYDSLIPELIKNGVYLSDNGALIYNLGKDQIKTLAESSNQVYYSRLL